MPHRVAAVAIFAGIVERVLLALLLGYLDAFGRRAEPSEQGEHRQRHDREHGDLAIGIEGPEIDEDDVDDVRSEEHTSELQSLMRISYAVFCLKKKKNIKRWTTDERVV